MLSLVCLIKAIFHKCFFDNENDPLLLPWRSLIRKSIAILYSGCFPAEPDTVPCGFCALPDRTGHCRNEAPQGIDDDFAE